MTENFEISVCGFGCRRHGFARADAAGVISVCRKIDDPGTFLFRDIPDICTARHMRAKKSAQITSSSPAQGMTGCHDQAYGALSIYEQKANRKIPEGISNTYIPEMFRRAEKYS